VVEFFGGVRDSSSIHARYLVQGALGGTVVVPANPAAQAGEEFAENDLRRARRGTFGSAPTKSEVSSLTSLSKIEFVPDLQLCTGCTGAPNKWLAGSMAA